MTQPTNSKYLDTKVLTSSQPRLHLLLLEGALRLLGQVETTAPDEKNLVEIDSLLARTADFLAELVQSVTARSSEISEQLEEQYAFIYRELVSCRVEYSSERIAACISLLEFQRETWRQACDLFENQLPGHSTPSVPHLAPTHCAPIESVSFEA